MQSGEGGKQNKGGQSQTLRHSPLRDKGESRELCLHWPLGEGGRKCDPRYKPALCWSTCLCVRCRCLKTGGLICSCQAHSRASTAVPICIYLLGVPVLPSALWRSGDNVWEQVPSLYRASSAGDLNSGCQNQQQAPAEPFCRPSSF